MTNPLPELLPCPFCGGEAEIRLHQYAGTYASGMETPWPYAACKKGCVSMPAVTCDDWPYGQSNGARSSKQARKEAIIGWNHRTPTTNIDSNTDIDELKQAFRNYRDGKYKVAHLDKYARLNSGMLEEKRAAFDKIGEAQDTFKRILGMTL